MCVFWSSWVFSLVCILFFTQSYLVTEDIQSSFPSARNCSTVDIPSSPSFSPAAFLLNFVLLFLFFIIIIFLFKVRAPRISLAYLQLYFFPFFFCICFTSLSTSFSITVKQNSPKIVLSEASVPKFSLRLNRGSYQSF